MTVHTPDLGVPAARNARRYAVAALVVTAVIGLAVWDLVGILLGFPLAAIGVVQAAWSWRPTDAYPRDRRALLVTFIATTGWVLLAAYIGSRQLTRP